MRYAVDYRASFQFNEPIFEQQTELRLVPRETEYQKTLSYRLEVQPTVEIHEHRDAFGNGVQSFSLIKAHSRWELNFACQVENTLSNPFEYPMQTPELERAAVAHLLKTEPKNWDFMLPRNGTVPTLSGREKSVNWPDYDRQKPLIYSVQSAMDWIRSEFRYEAGATDVHAPLDEVLEKRSGVCQDFAHLLMAVVRHWEFPARYVMGYQYINPKAGEENPPATHAWAEVYLPGAGWRGFDATHALLADQGYLAVAVGRDSRDVSPERGSFKGSTLGEKPVIQLVLSQQ